MKLIEGNLIELAPREPGSSWQGVYLDKHIAGIVESVCGPVFCVRPVGFTMTVFEFRADENEELAVNTVNGRLYEIVASIPGNTVV